MAKYRYETHLHTSEVSLCGKATAAEQVQYYAELGYAGIVVTDHFFNGNCAVPREGISWHEKVERFCLGYINAVEEGKKQGISVFFGWEYGYRHTDLLTYGLSPKWLLKNPQIMEMNAWDYCDYVRQSGGAIIQAHPFRNQPYIEEIRLKPTHVDGVEVINGQNSKEENDMALKFAKHYDLVQSAGSDNHTGYAHKTLAGIETREKLRSSEDLVEVLKTRKFKVFTRKI